VRPDFFARVVDLVTGVDEMTAGVDIVSEGGVALEGALMVDGFSGGSLPLQRQAEFRAGMLTLHFAEDEKLSQCTLHTNFFNSFTGCRLVYTTKVPSHG
jgi:hypothetical protein